MASLRWFTLPVVMPVIALYAHDLYLMPSSFLPGLGSTITVGFHVGDSFPESEVSGRLDRLKDGALLWSGGKTEMKNFRVDGKRDAADVKISGTGDLIAAIHTAPNFIELDATKFAAYLKEEGLKDVIVWRAEHKESSKPGKERYSKYAKSLLVSGAPNGFFNHLAGYPIEIVTEADPYSVKAGGSLPIQVLFRGKAAGDLQIETSWASGSRRKTVVVGRTGPDGRLNVPLPAAGTWRVHTIKMERCAEPTVADWESFWASLTFQLR